LPWALLFPWRVFVSAVVRVDTGTLISPVCLVTFFSPLLWPPGALTNMLFMDLNSHYYLITSLSPSPYLRSAFTLGASHDIRVATLLKGHRLLAQCVLWVPLHGRGIRGVSTMGMPSLWPDLLWLGVWLVPTK
jgi:hypothetical protein